MVAKPSSSGTRNSNTRFEVNISSTAPIAAPDDRRQHQPDKGAIERRQLRAVGIGGEEAARNQRREVGRGRRDRRQPDGQQRRKGDQRSAAGERRNNAAGKAGGT